MVAFAQNQRDEVRDLGDLSTALNLQGTHQQTFVATPFTKAKRAQSNADDESWVEGDVAPTQSCFDQGDVRATTVVAYDVHGTLASNGASQTDIHTALRSRMPGQSENSTTTVLAFAQNQLGEVRSNSEVIGTVNTNQNASGRNTPMVAYGCDDTAGTIRSNTRNNSDPRTEAAMHVLHGMAVRRLTPKECHRLQGFPDGYCDITYRGRPSADGPQYKALGNSMAVPVMRWIGQRIQECDVRCQEATDGR